MKKGKGSSGIFLLILVLHTALNLSAQEIDYKGLKQLTLHKKDSTEYVLYTPDSLERDKRYPIALFLHGCCGTNDHASLRNAVDPPMRMWHQFGANKQKIPTYIISPATSKGWKRHMTAIKAVIDELIQKQQGDSQRVYISGFSMGGEGTAQFLAAYPDFFAAAITMGMTIKASLDSIKHIPLWVNRGSEDYYGRGLGKQVAEMRQLNGAPPNDSSTSNRGINPVFTNFDGRGHGIQWEAVSRQNLTEWAYSKINDGNQYPNVWFTAPQYGKEHTKGEQINILAEGKDPDGDIIKTEFFVNGRLARTLTSRPFQLAITLKEGDTYIDAKVYDNKGKTANATTKIFVRQKPALVNDPLPNGSLGQKFDFTFNTIGNGPFTFALDEGSRLPPNFMFYPSGRIKGLPTTVAGSPIIIRATDNNGQIIRKRYMLNVNPGVKNSIVIQDAKNKAGKRLVITRLALDEAANFDGKDSVLRDELPETHFSDLGPYKNWLFIQTDQNDNNSKDSDAVSFVVDRPVDLLIAYEKLETQFTSTIPDWLKSYKKEPGQIVAQYRYYDVYSKPVNAGKIVLPGADAASNKVGSNYFIILRNY